MEETRIEEESTELEYPKAKLYKRWFAFLIDFILMALIGLFLFGLTNLVTQNVPSYANVVERRLELEKESGLYDSEGRLLTEVMEESEDSYDSKKDVLSNAIESFYLNETFFEGSSTTDSYTERKKNATNSDGVKIFTIDDNGNVVESNHTAKTYYDFYAKEMESYSLALLSANDEFMRLSRNIILTSVIELFICMGIGFFVSYILLPICSKKGRKTLGMRVFDLSLLSGDALVAQGRTFAYRQVLLFVVGYLLNIVAVLIPFLVSLTMMHLSKSGQDFFDYATGTYVIDSRGREVYRSIEDYNRSLVARREASIENNDFRMR